MHETWLSKKNRRIQQVSPMLWFIYWCSEWNKLIQGSIFGQKNAQKKGDTSIAHTNHFKQCRCTRMSAVQRCLSHRWTGGRDKHPYSVSPAGPSRLPGMLCVHQPTLTISSMNSPADDSPTDNGSSTNDSQEVYVKSVVEAVCTCMLSFCDAAKQFDIPATTISNRLKGGKAPSIAHESQQLLSNK